MSEDCWDNEEGLRLLGEYTAVCCKNGKIVIQLTVGVQRFDLAYDPESETAEETDECVEFMRLMLAKALYRFLQMEKAR